MITQEEKPVPKAPKDGKTKQKSRGKKTRAHKITEQYQSQELIVPTTPDSNPQAHPRPGTKLVPPRPKPVKPIKKTTPTPHMKSNNSGQEPSQKSLMEFYTPKDQRIPIRNKKILKFQKEKEKDVDTDDERTAMALIDQMAIELNIITPT